MSKTATPRGNISRGFFSRPDDGIFDLMSQSIHTLLVYLTSVALFVGIVRGTALCCEDPVSVGAHVAHAIQDAHSHHHHGTAHHKTDRVSAKCCELCLSAAAEVDIAQTAVVVSTSPIEYSTDCKTYSDRPSALDPGIPKRTA